MHFWHIQQKSNVVTKCSTGAVLTTNTICIIPIIMNHTSKFHWLFRDHCLWPWLSCPVSAAISYVLTVLCIMSYLPIIGQPDDMWANLISMWRIMDSSRLDSEFDVYSCLRFHFMLILRKHQDTQMLLMLSWGLCVLHDRECITWARCSSTEEKT